MAAIHLPPSKSISARALILNALSSEPCEVHNLSDCDDTRALRHVLQGGSDVGAAGTAMRFATALLASTPGAERTLTGSPRMLERPIAPLVEALRTLGADIEYLGQEGYPPLRIHGKRLQGGTVTMPGNISSQYISALMMVGANLHQGLEIRIPGCKISQTYIEMTRHMMAAWGAPTEWRDDNTLYIPAHAYTRTAPYEIEADWSAASYFLAAQRNCTLEGLHTPSIQGDSIITDYLRRMDEAKAAHTRLALDFTACPDIAQTMVVAACLAGCNFRFTGLESLRIKETDRIAALAAECSKFGWQLTPEPNGTLTYTQAETTTPQEESSHTSEPIVVATYNDHRMAMAFALCLLRWPNTTFDNPQVVTKSFPNFWQEFRKLL